VLKKQILKEKAGTKNSVPPELPVNLHLMKTEKDYLHAVAKYHGLRTRYGWHKIPIDHFSRHIVLAGEDVILNKGDIAISTDYTIDQSNKLMDLVDATYRA